MTESVRPLTIAQKRALHLGKTYGGIVPISGKGWWPLYNGLRRMGLINPDRVMTERGYEALRVGGVS